MNEKLVVGLSEFLQILLWFQSELINLLGQIVILVLEEFDSLCFLVILESAFSQLIFEDLNSFFVLGDLLSLLIQSLIQSFDFFSIFIYFSLQSNNFLRLLITFLFQLKKLTL